MDSLTKRIDEETVELGENAFELDINEEEDPYEETLADGEVLNEPAVMKEALGTGDSERDVNDDADPTR